MKGKKVEAPAADSLEAIPEIHTGPAPNPFAAASGDTTTATPAAPTATTSARRRWVWPAVGAVVVLAGSAAAWFYFRPLPPQPVAAPPRPAAVKTPKAATLPKKEPAPPAPVVAAPPAEIPAAAGPEPSPALAEKVRLLPLGAAMAGENARVLIGGKRFSPGDTVADGLVLDRVLPGLIVFKDANGALYTRRY